MSGSKDRAMHHYSVEDMLFVATGLNDFVERIRYVKCKTEYYSSLPSPMRCVLEMHDDHPVCILIL